MKKLLPIIGILIFIYLIYRIGVGAIWESLKQANIMYLIISFVLLVPAYGIMAIKWNYILKKQKLGLSKLSLIKIIMMAEFWGNITPGKLGTLMRIKYLKDKKDSTIIKCSSSVILDRAVDLISMLIAASIGALFLFNYFSPYLWILLMVLLIFSFVFILFIKGHKNKFVFAFISKLIPKKYDSKKFVDEFYKNFPNRKRIIVLFCLTFIMWFIFYVQEYVVALALGIKIPFLFFIISQAIAAAIMLIPITINGLGTREATLIALFSVFGISAGTTVAFSLLSLFLLAIIPACLGGFFILIKNK